MGLYFRDLVPMGGYGRMILVRHKKTLVIAAVAACLLTLVWAVVTTVNCKYKWCVPPWVYDRYACFETQIPPDTLRILNVLYREFDKLCVDNNITYVPIAGSMLAQYRHGGLIPWDDDLDVMIPWTQQARLMSAVKKSTIMDMPPGIGLYVDETSFWKVYLKHQNLADPRTSTMGRNFVKHMYGYWPYIDVFLYKESATHVWTTDANYPRQRFPKSQVFPLERVKFDDIEVYSVRRSQMLPLLLQHGIDPTYCEQSPHYRENLVRTLRCHYMTVSCRELEPGVKFVPGSI